ncbi:Phosphoribosylformylglycinamidine synthase subunit PurL [uncultured archaeon]|nr:Phosphoribosylformylglycinamidine synthase subunit PurL [uncultured archaeon]
MTEEEPYDEAPGGIKEEMERGIAHMGETHRLRKIFWHMDDHVKNLRFGIQQGDDAVIVGNTVVNMEGPYPLKIGRKTGLVHTCSDIVVMGGRPLYALDSMQVGSIEEANEVAEDIKKQSLGLGVPVLGGNTQMENNLTPCVSFFVVGELVAKPVPDGGARAGDRILMLGDVVEGSTGERVFRAKKKFETYLDILTQGIDVHASKDASRGGWFGNLMEVLVKSRKGANITSIPYSRLSRYMGTYLIFVAKKDVPKIVKTAAAHHCPIVEIGQTTKKLELTLGDETVVTKERLSQLISHMPYRKPREIKNPDGK